jgi:zinc transporter ZupT
MSSDVAQAIDPQVIERPSRPRWSTNAIVLAPLLVLSVKPITLAGTGDRILAGIGHNPPSADQFVVERVQFQPKTIEIDVVNPQAEAITPAIVTVDAAIVNDFQVRGGGREIGSHDKRTLVFPYQWIHDDPYLITIVSSSGVTTEIDVPAAVPAQSVTSRGLGWGALIGLLVGVVPVGLGLIWLPALRQLSQTALGGFLAFTAGLLAFLAVEAAVEAFDTQTGLIPAVGGAGIVAMGIAVSMAALALVGRALRSSATAAASRMRGTSVALTGGTLALLVAIGIGLHNLGEGLAIGSSFASGEASLAIGLVIGFMLHNVTEGIGIAAPLARAGQRLPLLRGAVLALVAGLPAVVGIWAGRYVAGPLFATLCFAIAAGAALQVIVEIVRSLRSGGTSLGSAHVQGGFAAGLLVMWATGILAG